MQRFFQGVEVVGLDHDVLKPVAPMANFQCHELSVFEFAEFSQRFLCVVRGLLGISFDNGETKSRTG